MSSLDSTKAAADLAQRIVALIGDAAQEPPPPPPAPTPGSDEDQDAGDEAGPSGGGAEAPGEAFDGDPNTGADSDADGEGRDGRQALQALQAVLSARADELPDDPFETVAEALAQQSTSRSTVLLPTLENSAGHETQGKAALARVRSESAKLAVRLQGLVQAHTMTQTRTVRRGRTLSANRLHRAAVGDDRIFARQERRTAPHTALHLLVDLSGSMRGYWDRIALDAAMALALALEPMRGVSCAVTAFPGRHGCPDRVARILSHGDRVNSRAGAFVQSGRGGTPMTGALWYAAADLLARREERKVVLTLTDGGPDDRRSAKEMVDRARAAGLEMIGVGIATPVAGLFPVAIRIETMADLKGQLFGIAERLLLA